MIGPANTNAADDHLQHFRFRFWENSENVGKRNLLEAIIEPTASRNPYPRRTDSLITSEGSVRVKSMSIVENVMNVDILLNLLHFQKTISKV